ncbi:FecR family protein [Methyloversatilis thermotolerans]|uniref:FecR family protein n=1 Tax=Methyloversatilis thermotolerans TaxID=1346290 RepID=UPI000382F1E1|nr:FecR family protein [Methyloversatilis thermotolerans]
MAQAFRPLPLALAIAAAFPLPLFAAPAARVEFTAGEVRAVGADGTTRPLAKGAPINSGDLVDTGSGRAQMRFTDGALVSLQPQTQFRVDDYAFAGKPSEDKGFFSLLKGGLRTITGLVGKGNRSNYKLTTSVATIGIRGTEYSVVYGNSINVTTGDGAIDVCNGAGCLTVSDGQSAYVAGQNTPPVITEIKTDLPAPPPSNNVGLNPPQGNDSYSTSEDRSEGGGLAVLDGYTGAELVSGDGYYMYGVYDDGYGGYGGYGGIVSVQNAPATIENGALVRIGNDGASVTAATVVESRQDGFIGWGRWTSATCSGDVSCSGSQVTDVHYIVGRPTADIGALGNVVGTYTLSGSTTPTSSQGFSGGSVSGTLVADFSVMSMNVSLNVGVSDTTFGVSGTGSISQSSFSGSLTCSSNCGSSASGSFGGIFAGSSAERAGMVYRFDSDTAKGTISGAAVFSQTSLTPAVSN